MSYSVNYFPAPGLSGQSLTITTSATVTLSAFPAAQYVQLSITGQNAYASFDGSVPTLSSGLVLVKDLEPLFWPIEQAIAAKFRAVANVCTIFATPLVTYTTQPFSRSLSSVMVTLSSYPVRQA